MKEIIERLKALLASIAALEPHYEPYDNGTDEFACPCCQTRIDAIYSPPGHLNWITLAQMPHEDDCAWLIVQQLGPLGIQGFLATTDDVIVDAEFIRARFAEALEFLVTAATGADKVIDQCKNDIENMVRFLDALVFETERARAMGASARTFELWKLVAQIAAPWTENTTPIFVPGCDYAAEITGMVQEQKEQADALAIIMKKRGDDAGFLRAMRHAISAAADIRSAFLTEERAEIEAMRAAAFSIEDLPGISAGARQAMIAAYAGAWLAAYQRGRDEVISGQRAVQETP